MTKDMSRKLTFKEAADAAKSSGYQLVKYAGSTNAYGTVLKCSCGNQWVTKLNNVTSSNKTGCPVCAKAKSRLNEYDIRKAVEAVGSTLNSIDSQILGQKTIVTVTCDHGHVRRCKLGTVIYAKKQCGECSRKERGVDLASLNSRLKQYGYEIIRGKTTRAVGAIKCDCGMVWEARINSVLQAQSHCPNCYDGGFRGDKPATFYVYELRKGKKLRYGYGITGRFTKRDSEHRSNAARYGWKISLCKTYEFDIGSKALFVEKEIKRTIPAPSNMFDGFKTEAVMPRHLETLFSIVANSYKL